MYWLKSSVPFLNCPKISPYSDPPVSTSHPSKVFPSPHEAFKSALTLVRRPLQSMLTDPIFSPSKRLSTRGSCNITCRSLCISSWTEIKECSPLLAKRMRAVIILQMSERGDIRLLLSSSCGYCMCLLYIPSYCVLELRPPI